MKALASSGKAAEARCEADRQLKARTAPARRPAAAKKSDAEWASAVPQRHGDRRRHEHIELVEKKAPGSGSEIQQRQRRRHDKQPRIAISPQPAARRTRDRKEPSDPHRGKSHAQDTHAKQHQHCEQSGATDAGSRARLPARSASRVGLRPEFASERAACERTGVRVVQCAARPLFPTRTPTRMPQ